MYKEEQQKKKDKGDAPSPWNKDKINSLKFGKHSLTPSTFWFC